MGEVAVGQQFHAVAGGADFLIDLKAALQRRVIVGAEQGRMRPAGRRAMRR